MKFTDTLAIIANDEGCDLIWNRDESVRTGEWVDFKLFLQLLLLLSLLLQSSATHQQHLLMLKLDLIEWWSSLR